MGQWRKWMKSTFQLEVFSLFFFFLFFLLTFSGGFRISIRVPSSEISFSLFLSSLFFLFLSFSFFSSPSNFDDVTSAGKQRRFERKEEKGKRRFDQTSRSQRKRENQEGFPGL